MYVYKGNYTPALEARKTLSAYERSTASADEKKKSERQQIVLATTYCTERINDLLRGVRAKVALRIGLSIFSGTVSTATGITSLALPDGSYDLRVATGVLSGISAVAALISGIVSESQAEGALRTSQRHYDNARELMNQDAITGDQFRKIIVELQKCESSGEVGELANVPGGGAVQRLAQMGIELENVKFRMESEKRKVIEITAKIDRAVIPALSAANIISSALVELVKDVNKAYDLIEAVEQKKKELDGKYSDATAAAMKNIDEITTRIKEIDQLLSGLLTLKGQIKEKAKTKYISISANSRSPNIVDYRVCNPTAEPICAKLLKSDLSGLRDAADVDLFQ